MGRPRYQRGFVEETGVLVRKWKVHWFVRLTDGEGNEDRRHRSRIVGRKPGQKGPMSAADAELPELTKAQAQAILDQIILTETGAINAPRRDGSMKFRQFYKEYWLPMREATWRENTQITIKAVVEKHVLPRWGPQRLDKIDAPAAAKWLGEVAQTYSQSMVHKMRTYLRSVMLEAVEQGFIPRDPLKRVKRPRTKKPDKTYLTMEEVWALRDQLTNFRDRLILDILLATGMRPGELFALRWSDVMEGALYIDEGFSRGFLEEPKTPHSIAAVAVPAEIMDRIALWCAESKPLRPSEFLFPTQTGTCMYSENWRKRILQPAAREIGLRVNYQIIRRTVVTLSVQDGVSIKAVQAQLRHASVDTTMNVYAQVVTAAQSEAAQRIFDVMKRKAKTEQAENVLDGGEEEREK